MANSSALTVPAGFSLSILDGFDLSKRDDSSPLIISLNAAFIALVSLVVSLRMFVRLSMVRALGVDDVLMVLASLTGMVVSGLMISAVNHGLGKHVWLIASGPEIIPEIVYLLRTLFICQIFYSTSISLTEASIIACYLRHFPHPTFRRCMKVIAFIVGVMWICSMFTTIIKCTPVKGAGGFSLMAKKCAKMKAFYYVAGVVGIIIDILLCTLPLPLLWRLKISVKEKVIVSILFGLGTFACISRILRLTTFDNLSGRDISSQAVEPILWSVGEIAVGIVCGSIPSLRPLFKKIIPSVVSRRLSQVHEMKDLDTSHRGSVATTSIPSARANPASEEMGSSTIVPKTSESEQDSSIDDLV